MDRFHRARMEGMKEVTVWGSGRPRREFLHVDDLASAALHVMKLDKGYYDTRVNPRCSHLNVGTGTDLTIAELAESVREAVGLDARLVFDASMPDGTPRKLLDIDRIRALGWSPSIDLASGLKETYKWYLSHGESIRR